MKSLFGDFSIERPKRISIYKLANCYFSDKELLDALSKYLASRKQQCNLPSKIAWEAQLKLLEKMPEGRRLAQVQNAILRGWRSIAFVEDKQETVTRNKNVKSKISMEAF